MAGTNGKQPGEQNDQTPPAHGEVVVFTPQDTSREPGIQVISTRRFYTSKISFEGFQQTSLAKLSFWLLLLFGLTAGALGFILGAVLGAVEVARISALVGAGLLGGLGGILALRVGLNAETASQGLLHRIGGALFVAVFYGAIGGLAGAVVVAFVGILCGAIAGSLIGAMFKRGPAGIGSGFLLGSLLGPLVLALYLNREKALEWGMHGAWIGAALGLAFAFLVVLGKREVRERELVITRLLANVEA